MTDLPPLDGLSHVEKDALIQRLWQDLQALRSEVQSLKQKRMDKKFQRKNKTEKDHGQLPGYSNEHFWISFG